MGISKSKFTAYSQCPKRMWMEINKPELAEISSSVEARFETGTEVGIMAQKLFGEPVSAVVLNEDGTQNLTAMVRMTEKLLTNNVPVVVEASFSYDDCYCAVDILRNVGFNEYELYEVKSSTHVAGDGKDFEKKVETYLPDVAYQKWVVEKCGYTVKSVNVVCLNSEYVLPENKDIDINQLFVVLDMTSEIDGEVMKHIEDNIEDAKKMAETATEPEMKLWTGCKKPYDCPFMKYCIKNNGIPELSVLNLYRAQWKKKIEYLNKDIITYEDVQPLVKSETQKMQIDCTINNKARINCEGIKGFLSTLSYPLYFLDFETMQCAVPEYAGSHPYQQIPFQYSLHIMKNRDDKTMEHREFLGNPDEDPRRALAEQLVNDIPDNVCVLAYNKSFECTRIHEMADLYPDLAPHLTCIENNIVDLMVPFTNCCYYLPAMKDSFSIKSVLPALYPNSDELNYHNLNENVQNGAQAMNVFPAMRTMNESQRAEMRKALLAYCKLDTLAMVRVLDKLYEAVSGQGVSLLD